MKVLTSIESKILFFALIVLGVLYIVKPDSGLRRELKVEKKAAIRRIDSIAILYTGAMRRINKLEKEVKAAHLVRVEAQKERDEAKRTSQLIRRKYESIKFINFSSDDKRDSVLMALYPHSFK